MPTPLHPGQTVEPAPPLPETLLTLAPLELPNLRHGRYEGDDLCVSKAELAAVDQRLLSHLYQALTELLFTIAGDETAKRRNGRRCKPGRSATIWTR